MSTNKKLPWYKLNVSDFRSGTRGMSLELRGFYREFLDAQWDIHGQLPHDEKKLAMMFCCNPRSVRKLMPLLIAMGKIVKTVQGYHNPRMTRDILGVNSNPIDGEFTPFGDIDPKLVQVEFEPNSSRIRPEFEPKVPKNPMFSTRDLETDSEVERKKEKKEVSPPYPQETANSGRTDDPNLVQCKLALNGSTDRLLDIVRNADGPYGTKATAAEWVALALDDYGADALIEALRFFERCKADGQRIVNPKGHLLGSARRHKQNAGAKPVPTHARKQPRPAEIMPSAEYAERMYQDHLAEKAARQAEEAAYERSRVELSIRMGF